MSFGFATPQTDIEAILGEVHSCVKLRRRCCGIQELPPPFPFKARPCGCELPSCFTKGPRQLFGLASQSKEGATTFRLPRGLLFWWTRAEVGLSRPPGRFYDQNQDTRAGDLPSDPGLGKVGAPMGLPELSLAH